MVRRHKQKPTGITKVLAYGRVSTADQEISQRVQEQECKAWYETSAARGEWPEGSQYLGILMDPAVSSRVDLFDRPQGQHILMELDRGDVLVVWKLSRAFRSAGDAERTMDALKECDIRLVILDMGIDSSTIMGKAMIGMCAVFARMEREVCAERTSEALRQRQAEGQWISSTPPPGWSLRTKQMRKSRDNELVPDPASRVLCGYCAREIAKGKSAASVATVISTKMRDALPNRATKLAGKWMSPDTAINMAAYHVCGFPPITRAQLTERLGEDPCSVEWIRRNHGSAPLLAST